MIFITFFSHSCGQRVLHVIGQESGGSIVDPIGRHHGHEVAGCADGVERLHSVGEVFVACVCGDPQQQTRGYLQRRQARIRWAAAKQNIEYSIIYASSG